MVFEQQYISLKGSQNYAYEMDRRRKQQRNVPESLLYTMHEEEGVETQECMEWR